MKRDKTEAIILRRTNYGDSDKIVTLLTRDFGRLSAIAKGVRKTKSRVAAGLEPFSVADVQFITGKGKMKTLVSARVKGHYQNIATDYERVKLGGELLKQLNELVEDDIESEFFNLASQLLEALNDLEIDKIIIEVWFKLQLLSMLGRQPELLVDSKNKKLDSTKTYHFDPESGELIDSEQGSFGADQIKAWRVLMLQPPTKVKQVKGLAEALTNTAQPLELFIASNSF